MGLDSVLYHHVLLVVVVSQQLLRDWPLKAVCYSTATHPLTACCRATADHLFVALRLRISAPNLTATTASSSVSASAPAPQLLGALVAPVVSGVAVWSGLQLRAVPGPYTLTLSVDTASTDELFGSEEVR